MARKRLTPAPPAHTGEAPLAGPRIRSLDRPYSPAPIARQAAETAQEAGLAEMAREMAQARETGRMVVDIDLDQIAPDHLTRDRIPADDADMLALRESLRAHGQRTPIEVTPVSGALPYGLISGWRRLHALKALHGETGDPRFATIRALIRPSETVAGDYVAMVEENEIRVGLSHYERARVAALATQRGVFKTEKEALLALFATASRAKRSRIRAFLEIYHELDGILRFPAHLTERLGLKLVDYVRSESFKKAHLREVLAREDPQTPDAEMAFLTYLMAPEPPKAIRPSRLSNQILPGVVMEESLKGRTMRITLKGKGMTPELRAEIKSLLLTFGQRRDPPPDTD